MIERRVVVTGIGVITPLGTDLPGFWENIKNGVSGIDRVTAFDVSQYDCQIAGEVKNFQPAPFFKNPKDVRRTDRYTQLAMAAAKLAVNDSNVDFEKIDPPRFG